MRYPKAKYRWKFFSGEKVSRKTKKKLIGTKMSKSKLRQRLASTVIIRDEKGRVIELSNMFCPNCGCEGSRSTGNMVEYPEVYTKDFCIRCGFLIGMADNSYWHHALEFEEYGFEIYV